MVRTWNERDFIPSSDLISLIYSQSKINLNDYYETCAIMAGKSSNNQTIIDNLEYYVFNNLMVYFKKIAENENGGKEAGSAEDQKNKASQQFSSSMRTAKQSMKPKSTHFKRR